jgi:hypothetical protein
MLINVGRSGASHTLEEIDDYVEWSQDVQVTPSMEVGGSKVEVRLLAAGLSRLSFLQLEESHTR